MSLFGSILGAGGGLLGGLLDGDGGAADAAAHNANLNKMIQNLFRQAMEQQDLSFEDARGQLLDRNKAVLKDANRGRSNLVNMLNPLMRQIRDQGSQRSDQVDQSFVSRGLSNSSVRTQAQRGVAADTQRNVQQAQTQQSSLLADADNRIAGIRSSLLTDTANLPLQRQSAFSNLINQFSSALGQQGAVAGPAETGGASFGGLLGGALGDSSGGNVSGLFGSIMDIFK